MHFYNTVILKFSEGNLYDSPEPEPMFHFGTFPEGVDHCSRGRTPKPPVNLYPAITHYCSIQWTYFENQLQWRFYGLILLRPLSGQIKSAMAKEWNMGCHLCERISGETWNPPPLWNLKYVTDQLHCPLLHQWVLPQWGISFEVCHWRLMMSSVHVKCWNCIMIQYWVLQYTCWACRHLPRPIRRSCWNTRSIFQTAF